MKKNLIITAVLILLASVSFSQSSNLIFFTEQGEQFFVVLNGEKQNTVAKTNVKVTNLTAPSYKCKIIFNDATLGQVDKTIYVKPGVEANYTIRKNNKNEWIVRWMNETAINDASNQNQNYDNNLYVEPNQNNQQVISTTTTTTTVQPQGNEVNSLGVNIVDPVSGVKMNMNINAGNLNTSQQSTTTTTYSTTTTTSGDDNVSYQNNNNVGHRERHENNQVVEYVPGYTGAIGCNNPMGAPNFKNVKQTIATKTFEDSKLTIAKQVLNNNCLLTSQVKEILLLFTYESTKLDFAKYAYGYTYDIGNYYMLNDAFQFESSIDELNSYISKKK